MLSGIAADGPAANLEISSAFTPVVFWYRTSHNATYMVLVGRAAVYRSVLEHGWCALCD